MKKLVLPEKVGIFERQKTKYTGIEIIKTFHYHQKKDNLDLYVVLKVTKMSTNLIVSQYKGRGLSSRSDYLIDKTGSELEMWEIAKKFMMDWTKKQKLRIELS